MSNTGNGARDVVRSYFETAKGGAPTGTLSVEDRLLAFLWFHGFKVVPLQELEDRPC